MLLAQIDRAVWENNTRQEHTPPATYRLFEFSPSLRERRSHALVVSPLSRYIVDIALHIYPRTHPDRWTYVNGRDDVQR